MHASHEYLIDISLLPSRPEHQRNWILTTGANELYDWSECVARKVCCSQRRLPKGENGAANLLKAYRSLSPKFAAIVLNPK